MTSFLSSYLFDSIGMVRLSGKENTFSRVSDTHNGRIPTGSLGLGKTYSALGVIKYFELRNHRVLVLCPKKLPENWTVYLAQNASELNPNGTYFGCFGIQR